MQMTKIVYQTFLTYISSQGEGGRRLRAVRDEAQQTEQQVIDRLPDLVFDWYTATHHSLVLVINQAVFYRYAQLYHENFALTTTIVESFRYVSY